MEDNRKKKRLRRRRDIFLVGNAKSMPTKKKKKKKKLDWISENGGRRGVSKDRESENEGMPASLQCRCHSPWRSMKLHAQMCNFN